MSLSTNNRQTFSKSNASARAQAGNGRPPATEDRRVPPPFRGHRAPQWRRSIHRLLRSAWRRRVRWDCSRSQGQPVGERSRAITLSKSLMAGCFTKSPNHPDAPARRAPIFWRESTAAEFSDATRELRAIQIADADDIAGLKISFAPRHARAGADFCRFRARHVSRPHPQTTRLWDDGKRRSSACVPVIYRIAPQKMCLHSRRPRSWRDSFLPAAGDDQRDARADDDFRRLNLRFHSTDRRFAGGAAGQAFDGRSIFSMTGMVLGLALPKFSTTPSTVVRMTSRSAGTTRRPARKVCRYRRI